MRVKRSWTVEQKLEILKEAEREGVTATIRKHQINGNTLYQWKDKYSSRGEDDLRESYRRIDPEVKRLEDENRRLKETIADKELAFRIKDEMLKKSSARRTSGE